MPDYPQFSVVHKKEEREEWGREGFTLRLFPGRPRRSFFSVAAFFGGILCLFLARGKGVVVKGREAEREMRRERRRDNVVVSVVVKGCSSDL
jgi:hypothetical protein